jgi:hypothetical protein
MRMWIMTIGVLAVGERTAAAQQLQPSDVLAIERAAAEYVVGKLPPGIIGFDGVWPEARGRAKARADAQIDALALALRAKKVRTDSVYNCPGDPSTCTLSVDALVRISEPYASSDGARVTVEVRRHGSGRQPVTWGADVLILTKQNGAWSVVGIARRSVS